MRFIKNYRSSLLLLLGVIVGGALGLIFGEDILVIKPIGDLFINMIFITIVPLVFIGIVNAIVSTKEGNRVGKILSTTLIVFMVTALIAAVVGYIGAMLMNPLAGVDLSKFPQTEGTIQETMSLASRLVQMVTVDDFIQLFNRRNLIPLIIFALIFGLALNSLKEKGKPLVQLFETMNLVIMKIVQMIMVFAPIGLGAYFATTIGELGPAIMSGYARSLLLYVILTFIYFFGFYSLYAFIAGGKLGVSQFWKHIFAPAITAMGTCSSAASIPVNLVHAKKMGIPSDIADTVLPLGANTHKDGSVIGGVIKVVFALTFVGRDLSGVNHFFMIISIAWLTGVVIGSIPGGGLTAETMIISVLGLDPFLIPMIAVISIIIDIPATLLNSTGNNVSAMLVARFVEGKNWLVDSLSKKHI